MGRYVHIRTSSARVRVGESVVAGQVLCESGDVGFCPTPHVHLQVHESADPTAPTVRFGFANGGEFLFVFPVRSC
eukprot:COSAG01_NODE_23066_length_829_cov_34.987671_1_plen_75_part_00